MSKNLKKPPISQGIAPGESHSQQIFEKPLSSTARNSKWSINIQEIVKRTQRNLEKGSITGQKASLDKKADGKPKPAGITGLNAVEHSLYSKFDARKQLLGFSALESELDKKSVLDQITNDYKSALNAKLNQRGDQSGYESKSALNLKINLRGKDPAGTIPQNRARPASAVEKIASQSINAANLSSNAIQSFGQSRLKRDDRQLEGGPKAVTDLFYRNHLQKASVNDGALQGAQGTDMNEQHKGLRSGYRTLEGQTGHGLLHNADHFEATLQEDQEAMIMLGNGRLLGNQRQHSASGLKNAPMNSLVQGSNQGIRSGSSLLIENMSSAQNRSTLAGRQTLISDKQNQMKDRMRHQELFLSGFAKLRSGPIVETIAEEQTNRNQNTDEISKSLERHAANLSQISGPMEEIGISTAPRDKSGLLIYDQAIDHFGQEQYFSPQEYNPGSRTLGNQLISGHGSSLQEVEQRQRIFEEEIIKRVKEIQRYIKTLHLQLKKTQGAQNKIKEEMESDKDILLDIQKSLESQQKRLAQDKHKFITAKDQEDRLRDLEELVSERMVQIVTEAVESTLLQVKDEMIPESKMQMYDAITEETNRLKIELDHELQLLRKEVQSQESSIRNQVDKLHKQEAQTLRNEIRTEQNAQQLTIFAQLESKIANEVRQLQQADSRVQLQSLKGELKRDLQTLIDENESRAQEKLKQCASSYKEIEGRLRDLETSLNTQLNKKIGSLATSFVTTEQLQDRCASLKRTQSEETRQLIGQQCLSLEQFRDEVSELKSTWQEDLELQKVATIKQLKAELAQDRIALKQELRADQDKALDRQRQELASAKDTLAKHQESLRQLSTQMEEHHRSNEILQNYNDLPDLVETLQSEIDLLKQLFNAKNDQEKIVEPLKASIESLRQKVHQLETKLVKNATQEMVAAKPSVDKGQLEEYQAIVSQIQQLKEAIEQVKGRIDQSTASFEGTAKRVAIVEQRQNSFDQNLVLLRQQVEEQSEAVNGFSEELHRTAEQLGDQFDQHKAYVDQNFGNLDQVMNEIQARVDSTTASKQAFETLSRKVDRIETDRIAQLEGTIEQLSNRYTPSNTVSEAKPLVSQDQLKRELKFDLSAQIAQHSQETQRILESQRHELSVKIDGVIGKVDKLETQLSMQAQKMDIYRNELDKLRKANESLAMTIKESDLKVQGQLNHVEDSCMAQVAQVSAKVAELEQTLSRQPIIVEETEEMEFAAPLVTNVPHTDELIQTKVVQDSEVTRAARMETPLKSDSKSFKTPIEPSISASSSQSKQSHPSHSDLISVEHRTTGNFELNSQRQAIAVKGDTSEGLERNDFSHHQHEPEMVLTSEVEEFNPMVLPTVVSAMQTEEHDRLSSQLYHELPIQENIKISTAVVPEWGNQSRSIKEGSQLFRTQKIAGLAALSQKATQQFLNGELDGMDELDEGEAALDQYLDGLEKTSKDESAAENILSGLKGASEFNSQEEVVSLGSQNKVLGNFLQKFEAKASKKSGLLNLDSQKEGAHYGEDLSEYAGKSIVDSILDSGNFCNEDTSPYRDMHSRNASGVPHQFADRFDKIKINSKLNRNKNDLVLSHNASVESTDKLRSDSESIGVAQASKAVLNMKFDKKHQLGECDELEGQDSILRELDLQSAASLSYQNSQAEVEIHITDENDPLIARIVLELVEREIAGALELHEQFK